MCFCCPIRNGYVMSDFEREMVHCLNSFFEDSGVGGFAYRLKQARFNTQYVDVIVDSLDPRYYLAIECKSLKGSKIYFTQHFHKDKNGTHQVDSISEFLTRTGRRGYLAVEFRGGSGKPNEAYLLPWHTITTEYASCPGITKDQFREGIALTRSKSGYTLEQL